MSWSMVIVASLKYLIILCLGNLGIDISWLSFSLRIFFFFIFFFLATLQHMEFLGQGPRSRLQLQFMPQLWKYQILNPLCQAGDWTCVLALQRCHWSIVQQQELLTENFEMIFGISANFRICPGYFEYHVMRFGSLRKKSPRRITLYHLPHNPHHTVFFLQSIFFFFFRAAGAAYGSFQAICQIDGLCHSHRNTRPEPNLWPAPQFTATPDP